MRRGGNVDAASPRQRSVLGGTISTPDLAVLGFGLGVLAATGWRRDRQLLSVVAGLACFAASDILVLRAINAGRWHVGVANAIVYATAVAARRLMEEQRCSRSRAWAGRVRRLGDGRHPGGGLGTRAPARGGAGGADFFRKSTARWCRRRSSRASVPCWVGSGAVDREALLRIADGWMYRAKRAGGGLEVRPLEADRLSSAT